MTVDNVWVASTLGSLSVSARCIVNNMPLICEHLPDLPLGQRLLIPGLPPFRQVI